MKFWRTMAVVTVALFAAATAFAAMAPKAPAAAGTALSCLKNTESAPVFPLVMATEYQETTSTIVGNGFPWENSTFFFSTFRNQYLYSSSDIDAVAGASLVIESIHARATSFSGTTTCVYGNFGNGDPSRIWVGESAGPLNTTFAVNPLPGTTMAELVGTAGDPITIGSVRGPGGAILSTCASCDADPACGDPFKEDCWLALGNINPATRTFNNVLVDQIASVAGGSGGGIWDTNSTAFGQGSPDGGDRAYGSGSFANPNHLTTALGVDQYDFVWVFQGIGLPPPATVEQQIKEIVRLLLTPQGLRCSGLDMNPGDGIIADDPIMFPMGRFIDPIQPQVTTGGTITGDETKDDLRSTGWLP